MPTKQPNVVSIATPEERAWERLRAAIIRAQTDAALIPLVRPLSVEWVRIAEGR